MRAPVLVILDRRGMNGRERDDQTPEQQVAGEGGDLGCPGRAVVNRLALHLGQHDHEQERHDDGTGIDNDRAAARNGAPARRKSPDVESTTEANQRALYTGLRLVTVSKAPRIAMMPKT